MTQFAGVAKPTVRHSSKNSRPGSTPVAANQPFASLEARIAAREARVGVVGRSHATSWLAEHLDAAGFATLVYRQGPARRTGRNPRGPANVDSAEALTACDVVVVAAPDATAPPDTQLASLRSVLAHWPTEGVQRMLLVESAAALPPTADLAAAANRWHRLGTTVAMAFFAELSPGRSRRPAATGLVAGHDDRAAELARALLAVADIAVAPIPHPELAAAADELRHGFTFVNAAFAAEFAAYCAHLGVDYAEVERLAATKPFGFMPFAGGHILTLPPSLQAAAGSANTISAAARGVHERTLIEAIGAIRSAAASPSLKGTPVLLVAPGAGRAGTHALADALEAAGAAVAGAARRREPPEDLPVAKTPGAVAVLLRPVRPELVARLERTGWRVLDLTAGNRTR